LKTKLEEVGLKKLGSVKRKAIGVSTMSLIRAESFSPGKTLPLVIEPAVRSVNLVDWAESNGDFINENLRRFGGILFRNFPVVGLAEFEKFARTVSEGDLLEYRERSSPRSHVGDNVYTSTDYPADQSIFLHNENSYQQTWPLKIFFFCAQAATQGGETPIADIRRIYRRIDPQIRDRFIKKKWMYVRNFNERFGLPWQTVFQSTDKTVVEEYCRRNNIEVEWRENNHLTTRAVRPAVMKHPRTGEDVWFNHAAFFHVTTLEPTMREVFLSAFKEEDLPTNTYYGDGSAIESSVLDELRGAYHDETVAFPWREGDILMLDNMLAAHGRNPYTGARKILVAMTEPISRGKI